ncbi:MAG: hypothetical protein ACK5MA_02100 [Parachlamydiaceae bacterium]
MVRLEGTPAFGLETKNWNADKFYKTDRSGTDEVIQQKAMDALQQIVKEPGSDKCSVNVMGMTHEIDSEDLNLKNVTKLAQTDAKVEASFFRKFMNKSKVLGYIPIIGTIMGILRLKDAAVDESNLHHDRVKHIVRGTVETLSLGFLLAIPDLIISFRHRHDQPEASFEEPVGDSSSYSRTLEESSTSAKTSEESSEYSSIDK